MARRSSARLRNCNSSTPKRVSHLVNDEAPKTVPAKLGSLREEDEPVPGAFPDSPSPVSTPSRAAALKAAKERPDVTPQSGTIRPSDEEMHPQLHHTSTAKPLEEARYLGFARLAPHTEPPKGSKMHVFQTTPSRTTCAQEQEIPQELKSPTFQFTFNREQSLELSPEAKKLMKEKREEAQKIRKEMTEASKNAPTKTVTRKIAKPKGRFSAAHAAAFSKMDSIAKSVPRTKPSTKEEAKSLKRSPTKAELDAETTPQRDTRGYPKLPNTMLPMPATPSPAKRVKRYEDADMQKSDQPSTPETTKNETLSHITTPTQSSLARAASVKSVHASKLPAPRSIPKLLPSTHTPLLSQSPSKGIPLPKPTTTTTTTTTTTSTTIEPTNGDDYLSRSPAKRLPLDEPTSATSPTPKQPKTNLLSRSPIKPNLTKPSSEEASEAPVPLLSRSPAKLTLESEAPKNESLKSRFAMLRTSPVKSSLAKSSPMKSSLVKSILRTPQRLYSNDPEKVAAGTHLATPENESVLEMGGGTTKHVDFTASTKERDAIIAAKKGSGEGGSLRGKVVPTKMHDGPGSPLVEGGSMVGSPSGRHTVPTKMHDGPGGYPKLMEGDGHGKDGNGKDGNGKDGSQFTFRSEKSSVLFPPTIRRVDQQDDGGRKRKYDVDVVTEEMEEGKENGRPTKRVKTGDETKKQEGGVVVDKGKGKGKQVDPPKARRPTLGVKPKGQTRDVIKKKKPTTISQARINALAQPKKRG